MKITSIHLFIVFLATIFALAGIVHGLTLNLTIATNKQTYNTLEQVLITGNLTTDGLPVSDALVAVEVDNPKNQAFAIRTLPTGPDITGPWNVEILGVTPCDSAGNPKYVFPSGGNAGFKVALKNNMANSYEVIITLSIFYANSAPFATFIPFRGSLDPGQTIIIMKWPVPIPDDAIVGEAMVFANAYNKLPKNGGLPYCPEEAAAFNITGTSSTFINTNLTSEETPLEGTFNLTIALFPMKIYLGNYTIYACTRRQLQIASVKSTFQVTLLGDLYVDGKIDMKDIAIVAKAFGTTPDDPNWRPEADLNPNGKIDMKDIAIVAKAFGTESVIDP